MPKVTATGIHVAEGATANINRKGKARLVVDANNGCEANGIVSAGTVTLTEQEDASIEVGHEVRTSSNGNQNNGERGKVTGIKILTGGRVTANRKDNASMLARTSDECEAFAIYQEKGSHLDLDEDDNAIIRVTGGIPSQSHNDSRGAEQQRGGDGQSVDAERHQESVMDKKGQYLYED